jgi:nitroreductase
MTASYFNWISGRPEALPGNEREDDMDFFDVVERRHSYRGALSGEPVPRGDLERIVQAGLAAPSGCNKQTTRFVVIDDPALLEKIHALPEARTAVRTAPALIACFTHRDPPPVYNGMEFEVEDCAAAVENMLLAIASLGYGSVWIDGWLRVAGRADLIGSWLDAPPERVLRVLLPVGRPVEEIVGPVKKPFAARAAFNRFAMSDQD